MSDQEPMIADRPLYLDEAGTSIVEDSEEARAAGRVLCWRGGEIATETATRLGLIVVDGRVVQGTPAVPADVPLPPVIE